MSTTEGSNRARRTAVSSGGYAVLIRGPIGVGKSTVSEALAQQIGGSWISIDRILDERGIERWKGGFVSEASFLRANTFAIAQASDSLARGRPAVFDGNFYWRSAVEDLDRRVGHPLHVFTLKAPLEVCLERNRGRSPPQADEGTRKVYAKATGFDVGVSIDATRPLAETVAAIRSHLPR
ncbi:MAG TPA: ATP-binding protein [Thermoplasmata archaeon]